MTDRWSITAITATLLPILLVLTALEIGGGLTLGRFESTLLRYPSLLVLVPVIIGTAGNLGSILAARVGTAVHLGLLSLTPRDDQLLGNAIATIGLAATIFPLIGAGAWLLTSVTGTARLSIVAIVIIATLSGLVLGLLAIVVTVVATAIAFRREVDPDAVVLPVVTNVCDVLGVLVLFAVVRVMGV